MYPQLDLENIAGPIATLETTLGTVKIKLFKEQAPVTVENFVGLIEKGYYDGTIFHRVIKQFMVQGGDPTGTGMGGTSIWERSFEDEFSNEVFNFRGALSMANAGPNTNGSQFFIVQAKQVPGRMLKQLRGTYDDEVISTYAKIGGTPWLDGKHTVFGHVLEGMDIVDQMTKQRVDYADKPETDIVIKKATVSE